MTPEERVKTLLCRKRADRVALDYYARGEVTAALLRMLRLNSGEALLRELGIDLAWERQQAHPER